MKKTILALLLTITTILSLCPAYTAAATNGGIGITPNYIMYDIDVEISAEEVWGNDEVEVTITFVDTLKRPVPFTITTTNGAKILVDSEDDVVFITDGIQKPISWFTLSPDKTVLTLETGYAGGIWADSTLTFTVKAPVPYTNFTLTVTSDNVTEPGFIRVPVLSGLTIDAPEIVDDLTQFTINGAAKHRRDNPPAGSYVFLEIINPDDHINSFVESQRMAIIVNGTYEVNDMHLFSDLPDGTYLIRAYLVDRASREYIAYAEKEIVYVKRPDVLSVSLERIGAPAEVKIDPLQGNGILDGVHLEGVRVAIPTRVVYSWNNVTARVTMKNLDEVSNAINAQFVVYTSFGPQYFPATRIGNQFFAFMDGLHTDLKAQGTNLDPYVYLEYTYQDVQKNIYVGSMGIIIDPAGNVVDAITGLPVQGAIVTLYKQNQNGSWSIWQPPIDQVNPKTTDALGAFEWDVEEGVYMIMVYHPNYNTINTQYSTLTDPNIGLIEIPPERSDIIIRLPNQI